MKIPSVADSGPLAALGLYHELCRSATPISSVEVASLGTASAKLRLALCQCVCPRVLVCQSQCVLVIDLDLDLDLDLDQHQLVARARLPPRLERGATT